MSPLFQNLKIMKQFIICPNCGAIELAEIEETVPFWSYIHDCTKCDYCIMESEWNAAKAISIKQPWSYLIASRIKPIENRTWKTNFRGSVLIHVGAKVDERLERLDLFTPLQWGLLKVNREKYETFAKYFTYRSWPTSAIIGSVEIVDCIQNSQSGWAEPDCWHWVLKDPVLFENPIMNVKGKLSFFIPQLPENV